MSGEKNWKILKMTFTGTLIEDLMATVERAEQRLQSCARDVAESALVDALQVEPWFAAVRDNREYESKILGVA